MPEEGPFVSKELKPSQKLASLTSNHVKGYIRDWETEDVVLSIGDFPNVPLIGTKGCINYNPVLSLRQHGYPMNGPPKAEALEPFILHIAEADHPMVKKIKRSWKAVIRKGKELGKRNVIAREPYTCWVRERVQMVKLPFPFDPSIYPLVPEPEPILPEDVEKLNARSLGDLSAGRKESFWPAVVIDPVKHAPELALRSCINAAACVMFQERPELSNFSPYDYQLAIEEAFLADQGFMEKLMDGINTTVCATVYVDNFLKSSFQEVCGSNQYGRSGKHLLNQDLFDKKDT
ncbi:hypothetical protein KIW84_033769 [Lathyrus oleraceus]|uniref:DUF7745 domain-containing protein n=1 Tax=Pisum sativum TaxID=3888 RepID=A0A9D5B3J5_PEA|nr:hypothetical protein KIW84_033769 [Pisum sativum]